METLGQYLKRQRELRSICLEDVAKATKISIDWLRAIEGDNFDVFAADVFAKGFVKAYAKHVGLDPDEVAIRYDEYRISELASVVGGGSDRAHDAGLAGGVHKFGKKRWLLVSIIFAVLLIISAVFLL